jgi:three-Cys-motif partner protein
LQRVLDGVPRSSSALVYIDPGGYRRLYWSTIEKLVAHGKDWNGAKMELLIIFPLEMALLRNMMRLECQESITRFFGGAQWEDAKRQRTAGKAGPEETKRRLLDLYKEKLRGLGYRFVEDFKPASPSPHPYYHLISASDSGSRLKNLQDAWGKSRYLRCELLYRIDASKQV